MNDVVSSRSSIHDFFEYMSLIVTTTTTSCKRRDALTEAQHQDILDRLESGENNLFGDVQEFCGANSILVPKYGRSNTSSCSFKERRGNCY